jgi:precorrin-6B C5,15-methyltransferase / cobalt-precorrin-6B C5,C15-methyltransferase
LELLLNMLMTGPWLSIVGIGEDGWDGLSKSAREAVASAEIIYGGARHLAFLPKISAQQLPWKSPLSLSIDELLTQYRGRPVSVLASGDPMLHGIGSLLTSRLDSSEYVVFPHLSAFSLACARLGWPSAETLLVSLVNSPTELLVRYLHSGQRLVAYSRDRNTPQRIIKLLVEHGYGGSRVTVFERLNGPSERRDDFIASAWETDEYADLNVVAIACVPDTEIVSLPLIPGLPDDAFETDGQLTKREVRAATLACLSPLPGQTLWDVGAGTGTVGIEWMRVHPSCICIAFEERQDRADRIAANARQLGVPGLQIVVGPAPATFEHLAQPDAVFIGGGISTPGLLEACWACLPVGGRLVANTVTVAGEALLATWQATHGGDLTRIAVSRATPIGGMLAWRPLSPITQLAATKS